LSIRGSVARQENAAELHPRLTPVPLVRMRHLRYERGWNRKTRPYLPQGAFLGRPTPLISQALRLPSKPPRCRYELRHGNKVVARQEQRIVFSSASQRFSMQTDSKVTGALSSPPITMPPPPPEYPPRQIL
jgi:hypothetical protein